MMAKSKCKNCKDYVNQFYGCDCCSIKKEKGVDSPDKVNTVAYNCVSNTNNYKVSKCEQVNSPSVSLLALF